jgi:hypothetical protein
VNDARQPRDFTFVATRFRIQQNPSCSNTADTSDHDQGMLFLGKVAFIMHSTSSGSTNSRYASKKPSAAPAMATDQSLANCHCACSSAVVRHPGSQIFPVSLITMHLQKSNVPEWRF